MRPLLTAKALSEDWPILRRALITLHPGLNRYNTPAQIDKNLEELRVAWSKDQSLQDAYLALSIFLAKIKCGHTYANFFNQTDYITHALFEQQDKVPFYFCWLDGHMIVTRDMTPDGALPIGTDVQTINGVPVKSILKKLLTVARSDGSNDAKRIANMEVNGSDEYEGFDVFYPLFYPLKSSPFVFNVRRPQQAKLVEVKAEALDHAQRIAPIAQDLEAQQGDNTPLWHLNYLKPNVGYLEMKTWVLYNSKWDWTTALNATFDELNAKQIPYLIIDLRANEGGNSVGDVILQRLITQEIKSGGMLRRTKYREVPADLRPYVSTWDKSFYNWGDAVHPVENGFFEFTETGDSSSVIKPSGTPYRGKVFVLVGSINSSATFNFAQQVQQQKLGTLVGQPTGGNQRGINGSAFLFVKLPHSQIEFDIPLVATFPRETRPDAGIQPDVLVSRTAADIAEKRDSELERTLELIKG